MAIKLQCPGCNNIMTILSHDSTGYYRCDCGIVNVKRAMMDMAKLREKKTRQQAMCPDVWDKAIANEPVGMSYQEGERRIAV